MKFKLQGRIKFYDGYDCESSFIDAINVMTILRLVIYFNSNIEFLSKSLDFKEKEV